MGKKPRNKKSKKGQEPPQMKDDGTRWTVLDAETDRPIYVGKPILKQEAERLSYALVCKSKIVQIS